MAYVFAPDAVVTRWLYAGPFGLDATDRFDDPYEIPYAPFADWVAAAEAVRAADPGSPRREGETAALFGDVQPYRLYRPVRGETSASWVWHGVFPAFRSVLAYTRLVVDRAGPTRVDVAFDGTMALWLNGEPVFEHREVGRIETSRSLVLPLREGVNHVHAVLSNVHMICRLSVALRLPEQAVRVELPLRVDGPERQALEDDFDAFFPADSLPDADADLRLRRNAAKASAGRFRFMLRRDDRSIAPGVVWEAVRRLEAGETGVRLCGAAEMGNVRRLRLSVERLLEDGTVLDGPAFPLLRVRRSGGAGREADAPDYAERKARFWKEYAAWHLDQPCEWRQEPYRALIACHAAWRDGRTAVVRGASITGALDAIERRLDCSDFAMHGLLRLYRRCVDRRHAVDVDDATLARMRAVILGFRLWVDEPGPSRMFTRSENHEILFHSLRHVAGLWFPDTVFPNSGRDGRFHAREGGRMAERWLRDKGRHGFTEWLSNCYFEEDLLALLTLRDFGEADGAVRRLAGDLLEFVAFLMASHAFRGVMATTHGRSYEHMVLHPEAEAVSHVSQLLFGRPERRIDLLSLGAVALADSDYAPDPRKATLARDETPLETRHRSGFLNRGGREGKPCVSLRTRDYMVSAVMDPEPGRFAAQVHVGQVTLADDPVLPVFVTSFATAGERASPSYWCGQASMPRVTAWRNTMALVYRLDGRAGGTHCHFPRARFDRVEQADGWFFGQRGDGYVGVFVSRPATATGAGAWRDRELLCLAPDPIWILEAGDRAAWGDFAAFVRAHRNASWRETGGGAVYASPRHGPFSLAFDRPGTVDGQVVDDGDFPLIGNDRAYGEFGSGVVEIRWPETETPERLDFRDR